MSQNQQVKFYTVQKILCKPSKNIVSSVEEVSESVKLPTSKDAKSSNSSPLVAEKVIIVESNKEKYTVSSPDGKSKPQNEKEATRLDPKANVMNSADSYSSGQVSNQEDKTMSNNDIQSSASSCKNSDRRTMPKDFEMPEFKQKLSELKSLEESLKKNEGGGATRKTNQNRDINYFLERRNTPRGTPQSIKIDESKLPSTDRIRTSPGIGESQAMGSFYEEKAHNTTQEHAGRTPSPRVQFKDEFQSPFNQNTGR